MKFVLKPEIYFALALEMESLLKPDKVKAIGFDKHSKIVYAAVEHKGFTAAICAPYHIGENGDREIDGDSLDGEIEGSLYRTCPLSVLEKLSPLSEYPYSATSKQFARQWRRDCLQRVIRSKVTSDADKAKAAALIKAI